MKRFNIAPFFEASRRFYPSEHAFACLLLFCWSFTVQAQDTIKIKEVKVFGSSANPAEISFQKLDSMKLMDPANKDLGASLQKYSHAFVKSYGIGSLATVSLRGSGSTHTNLMWNGTQLNSASAGLVDFSLIPPFFTEEVGVSYGQNSLQSASGGLGGAVMMKNTIDFSNKEEIFMQQQVGSFKYHSTALRIKMGKDKWRSVSRLLYKGASNNFQYSNLSEVGQPRTSIENAQLKQRGVLQSFHYRPTTNQRFDMNIWYFDSERELPNMMALKNLEESQYDENFRIQLAFHQYLKSSKLTANSTYLRDKIIYRNNQLANNSLIVNHSFRNYLELESNWRKYLFKARFDADQEVSEQANYTNEQIERSRQALYTEIKRSFGKSFNTSIAARQELIQGDYFFLPQVRFDVHLKEASLNYWVLFGENMKYPSLNDLYWSVGGNSTLRAEQSKSVELGQAYTIKLTERNPFEVKATLFYSMIDDYIQWTPTSLGFWQAQNLKKVESKGVEIDLQLNHKGERVLHTYSFLYNYVNSVNLEKSHADDASKGKQLIYVPEHQYDVNARWMYQSFLVEGNLQFVGARYLLSDNTDYLPYYEVIDLTVGKDWKLGNDQLSTRFTIRNLFNKDYQAIQWRPMPGRNYMLTVNYLLK